MCEFGEYAFNISAKDILNWVGMTFFSIQSFSNFGVICDGYVHGCEYDSKLAVEDLFAFLDGRVEKWNKGILSAKILSVETELKEL